LASAERLHTSRINYDPGGSLLKRVLPGASPVSGTGAEKTMLITCPKCKMTMTQQQADCQVRCVTVGCQVPGAAKHGAEYRMANQDDCKKMGGIIIGKGNRSNDQYDAER
jgi:hypothetical protein